MTIKRILPLLLINLCIASCATVPTSLQPQNKNLAWESRTQTLSAIQNWNVKGAVAIRTPQNAISASIQWQQHQENYHISLFGPLGSHSYELTGQPGAVTLAAANGQTFHAASAEELLAQQAGWRLPLANLRYWIRGLPVPNMPAEKQFDTYHHLVMLQQAGWAIQYLGFTSVNNIDVPNKIFLNNAQLNVKIVIYEWQL